MLTKCFKSEFLTESKVSTTGVSSKRCLTGDVQLARAWFLPVHTCASLSSQADDGAFSFRLDSMEDYIRILCWANFFVREVHWLRRECTISVPFVTWIDASCCCQWDPQMCCMNRYRYEFKYLQRHLQRYVLQSNKLRIYPSVSPLVGRIFRHSSILKQRS